MSNRFLSRHFTFAVLAVVLGIALGVSLLATGPAPTDPKARGIWLLERVKGLADSGRIDDPAFIGDKLGTAFTSSTRILLKPPSCGDTVPAPVETTFKPNGKSWYRPMAGGKRVTVGIGFDTPTVTGSPIIDYLIRDEPKCEGRDGRQEGLHEARLVLGDTPEFVCTTSEILKATIPSITRGDGSDGGEVYFYEGTGNDRIATRAEFAYGSGCLIGIAIVQSTDYGYRRQRAWIKANQCQLDKMKAMCNGLADLPGDAAAINERSKRAREECGTIDWFAQELDTGQRPPPFPDPTAFYNAMMCKPIR